MKSIRRYFCISDLHLEHANTWQFKDKDGDPARPNPITGKAFNSMEEHDAFIIEQWNKTVNQDGDTVYLLGDACINKRGLHKLGLLNGRKILVPGNHDIFHYKDYAKYFDDIRGCIVRNNIVFSHFPFQEDSIRRYSLNVHGHTHSNNVSNPKYLNVSLEQTNNFCPIHMDEIYAYRDIIRDMSTDHRDTTD